MANLSQAQIAMYAQSAGMANPQVMAAIAMAESGGNPRAHNPVPPDNSYGLWQINMIGSMGPARRQQYGISSNEELYDPAVNARAAAKILKSQGPSAWSTYSSGAYKKYLNGSSGATNATNAVWDPLGSLAGGLVLGPGGTLLGGLGGMDGLTGGLTGDAGSGLSSISDVAQLAVKAGEWMSNPRNWLDVLYVTGGGILILITLSATVRSQVTKALGTVQKVGVK
jgi:hypothetical protein